MRFSHSVSKVLVAVVTSAGLVLAAPAADAAMTARGSIGEAYVLGAKPRQKLRLLDKSGKVAQRGTADRFGSFIFRALKQGASYKVQTGWKGKGKSTPAFKILRAGANPPQSFYSKIKLQPGLNYVTMRDGTSLAMTVRLPAGATSLDSGPFPTLIEYSGYQTAAPGDLLSGFLSGDLSNPLLPSTSTVLGSLLGQQLGFATVSVQMRGSGCSGGAFDLFDLPTTYDGYDAVETVGAQSWVKGKVGMIGISFSGITQLFTAGTRPPHLAAITPMSVTDDIYTGTGYPGGINNIGFARSWIQERMSDAKPAPAGGQPYAKALIAQGDKQCKANQALRLQTQNALKLEQQNPFRTPAIFDQRAPSAWMGKINVPTFLVGSFQDEQTGGHFTEALSKLNSNPNVWITLQNGVHVDSLTPDAITRWVDFLKIYVAGEVPQVPPMLLSLSSVLYQKVADVAANPVVQSRFATMTSVDAAKAAFQQDPRVRVLMDNGGGPQGPGSIGSPWELDYSSWPVKEAAPTSYYLGDGGALTADQPAAGTASYVADPKARPEQTLPGSGQEDAWKGQPPYNWTPIAAGKGLGWTSAVLDKDVVIAGPSSFDVYLKSTAADTDLQVTLSEVRPDGRETYIQNGWLRASHRKLAPGSTALDPVQTHLKKDAAPLPKGKFTLVRVPVWGIVHAFRAGSRIRVTLEAPGGDRPRWAFASIDKGKATDTVSLGGATASKLVLPVIPGATALGTPLPAPTALRGEPDRAYAPASNGG